MMLALLRSQLLAMALLTLAAACAEDADEPGGLGGSAAGGGDGGIATGGHAVGGGGTGGDGIGGAGGSQGGGNAADCSGAEWVETYDDPADFSPPEDLGGDFPYAANGMDDAQAGGAFFLDHFDADIGTDFSADHRFAAWHVDRPGHGMAFKFASAAPEMSPLIGELYGNPGVRWRFDLWIGPEQGTYRHTAAGLKFLHLGAGDAGVLGLTLGAPGTAGYCRSDLQGGLGTCGDVEPFAPGARFRNYDDAVGAWMMNDTPIPRETWTTVEIEVDCGTQMVRIWIDGQLDYHFQHITSYADCFRTVFVNYSQSASGDVYLGVDNFCKFDTVAPGL